MERVISSLAPQQIDGADPGDEDDGADAARLAEEADVERRARAQGWTDRTEWRGDPLKWTDARTFLERGEKIAGIAQKRIRDLENQNLALRGEIETMRTEFSTKFDDQSKALKELLEVARTANESGYNRAIAELKAQQRQAAAEGNVERYDAVSEQITAAEEERAARAQPTPAPRTAPGADAAPMPQPKVKIAPEVLAFVDENPWFNTDPVLHAAMEQEHVRILREMPGLSLADNLERAKAIVVKEFPKKFGIAEEPAPRRPAGGAEQPSGDRGGGSGGREKNPLKIASIEDPDDRAEARKQFDRQRGFNPDLTEEIYMRLWRDPHADVTEFVKKKPQGGARA